MYCETLNYLLQIFIIKYINDELFKGNQLLLQISNLNNNNLNLVYNKFDILTKNNYFK